MLNSFINWLFILLCDFFTYNRCHLLWYLTYEIHCVRTIFVPPVAIMVVHQNTIFITIRNTIWFTPIPVGVFWIMIDNPFEFPFNLLIIKTNPRPVYIFLSVVWIIEISCYAQRYVCIVKEFLWSSYEEFFFNNII